MCAFPRNLHVSNGVAAAWLEEASRPPVVAWRLLKFFSFFFLSRFKTWNGDLLDERNASRRVERVKRTCSQSARRDLSNRVIDSCARPFRGRQTYLFKCKVFFQFFFSILTLKARGKE